MVQQTQIYRILGIDPGLATIGWGVIKYEGTRFQTLGYGSIQTPSTMSTEDRLVESHKRMNQLIQAYKPDAMAIEKLFYNTNAKTVIDVAQARGVINLAAQKNNLDIFEYTPLQVKQSIVGYGRAEKFQVQEMTRTFLHLDKIPKPDDAADGVWCAYWSGLCIRILRDRKNGQAHKKKSFQCILHKAQVFVCEFKKNTLIFEEF